MSRGGPRHRTAHRTAHTGHCSRRALVRAGQRWVVRWGFLLRTRLGWVLRAVIYRSVEPRLPPLKFKVRQPLLSRDVSIAPFTATPLRRWHRGQATNACGNSRLTRRAVYFGH
ncbi:hypothetical protein CITRIK5_20241 [Citricoccus sp. K5]|nr:hypothetical protein CITRIK5_20241 [Citricoccus sp. K5]